MLLISEISFVDNEVGSAITHGSFPVASWQAALTAMKTYADKWSEMTDLSSSYWMIELFNLANDPSCSYPYDGFYSQTTLTTQTSPAKSSTSAGKKRANAARCSIASWVESLARGSRGRTLTYPHRTKRETFLKSTADHGARTLLLPGSKLEIGLSVSRWRWADQMWLYPLRQLLCRMGTYELDAVARV